MAKWISIKRIGINGYKGAVIYKLSFDNGRLFYIGSTVNASTKPAKWVHTFRRERQNKRMKEMIQDKSCATFEIIEKVFDVSKLFEREEYHIQKHFNSPFILNRSRYASGALDESESIRKPVNQYKDGKLIAEYRSVLDAAKAIGKHVSKVWDACHNDPPIYQGYKFAFANPDHIHAHHSEQYQPKPKKIKPPKAPPTPEQIAARKLNQQLKRGKPIEQLAINGIIVNEFICTRAAAEALNISYKAVRKVVQGYRKSTFGFQFRYKNSTNQSNEATKNYHQSELPL